MVAFLCGRVLWIARYFSDGQSEMVPPRIRSVVSKDTAREIGMMLRDVVVNGWKARDVPGYLVVGKTGTAQVAKSDAKV